MHELTHVDICSGGGGFSVAAEWAGFRTLGFSEIEPFPCFALSQLWPGTPNLGDLRRITVNPFGAPPTLLTGGIPCQPASQAGKGLGSADPRWLWYEAIRLLSVFRPRYAVFENPAGILTVRGPDGRRELPRIVGGLHGAGYHVWWQDLSAAEIGASHGRERIWIVCVRMDDTSRDGDSRQDRQAEPGRGVCGAGGESNSSALAYDEVFAVRAGLCQRESSDLLRQEAGCGRFRNPRGEMAHPNAGGQWREGDGSFKSAWLDRSGGGIPQHPPGPKDIDGWRAVLERAPWLAPAVEPGVCWLADGLPLPVDSCRAAVLSLLGNAIHPETVYPILAAIAEIERGELEQETVKEGHVGL